MFGNPILLSENSCNFLGSRSKNQFQTGPDAFKDGDIRIMRVFINHNNLREKAKLNVSELKDLEIAVFRHFC